jgi:hypothetical protein
LATNVNPTQDLNWTAGAYAASHDVYFGTANPPPFIGNKTAATYDTGTMTANTTYYWRIDEKNASGTTTGTVWSFTTSSTSPLPGAASNPMPPNGAMVNGDYDITLSWTAGAGATSHDIYLGMSNPPSFIGNQTGTGTAYHFYGPKIYYTTYYWRIDEKNANGTTTGTVWSMYVLEPPPSP